MARGFVSTSQQWLSMPAPVSAMPLTVAARGRVPVDNEFHQLIELHQDGATGHKFELAFAGTKGRVRVAPGTGNVTATTVTSISANTWYSLVGVATSTTSRTIHMSDGNSVTNTDSVGAPEGVDILRIGKYGWSGPGNEHYSDGDEAEVAIWNIALTSAEAASYNIGVSPSLIRPSNLVCYIPFGGLNGEHDYDLVSGTQLTAYNSPTWTEQPSSLIYPTAPQLVLPSYVEAGDGSLATSAFQLGMFIND